MLATSFAFSCVITGNLIVRNDLLILIIELFPPKSHMVIKRQGVLSGSNKLTRHCPSSPLSALASVSRNWQAVGSAALERATDT